MSLHIPAWLEPYRVRKGIYATSPDDGANGVFVDVKRGPFSQPALILASSGIDAVPWEHVNVALELRCPTWEEMEWVKREMWDEGDLVVQFHPPLRDYVNVHPYCLHMWRYLGGEMPRPEVVTMSWAITAKPAA